MCVLWLSSFVTARKALPGVCTRKRERSNLTLACSSADVGDEASPAGVRLGGALLTGVAPRSTNGSTAEGFSADNSTELALTHLVVYLGETWPSPVVCRGKEARILC